MNKMAHCPSLVGLHAWYRETCARLGGPPSRRDLDPSGFPFVLGRELLIEYHRGGEGGGAGGRARYRLVGAEINERGGVGEQTGRWLDETLRSEDAARLTRDVAAALAAGAPRYDKHEVERLDGLPLCFGRLLLPLSRLPGEAEMVFAADCYRAVEDVPAARPIWELVSIR
jgi:hypothetical protein